MEDYGGKALLADMLYQLKCKCRICNHHSIQSCIDEKCDCCDAEDLFSIVDATDSKDR